MLEFLDIISIHWVEFPAFVKQLGGLENLARSHKGVNFG